MKISLFSWTQPAVQKGCAPEGLPVPAPLVDVYNYKEHK